MEAKEKVLGARYKKQREADAKEFGTNAMYCSQTEKRRRRRMRLCVYCASKLCPQDIVLCARCRTVKRKKPSTAVFYSDSSASEGEGRDLSSSFEFFMPEKKQKKGDQK